MEYLPLLPKDSTMAQIEMLSQITSLLVPDSKFIVNLTEIEELEKVTENTFENSDFFIALEELKKIESNVAILAESLNYSVELAKMRICPRCAGSGYADNSNNDNPPTCKNCDGGLL